jgi:hypothetical protein
MQTALAEVVADIPVATLNEELSCYAEASTLQRLASSGIRGEVFCAVPAVLEKKPTLLAYYRLLLGFSQKEFYNRAFGTGRFKVLEERGVLNEFHRENLASLCRSLNNSMSHLVASLEHPAPSMQLAHDLALLTLGPQLRGGANVRKGTAGIVTVFKILQRIVSSSIVAQSKKRIAVSNSSGRIVEIAFAPDPDIVITESHSQLSFRNIVAIEVKSGTDFSNIHNRLGEAEKSHQKARAAGFVECWTIVNVDNFDHSTARKESPSTHRFYSISGLTDEKSEEFSDFRYRVLSMVGLPSPL